MEGKTKSKYLNKTIKREHNINTINKYKNLLDPKIYTQILNNLN